MNKRQHLRLVIAASLAAALTVAGAPLWAAGAIAGGLWAATSRTGLGLQLQAAARLPALRGPEWLGLVVPMVAPFAALTIGAITAGASAWFAPLGILLAAASMTLASVAEALQRASAGD